MIHTIVNLEEVFAEPEAPKIVTEKTDCGYAEYITVNGKRRIHRLISTKPADYLKQEYQPFRFYS